MAYRLFGTFTKYLVLGVFALLVLYPLLLIVSTSFKDPLDVTADPFTLFSSFNPINFLDAWTLGGFAGFFWNTVIITGLTLAGGGRLVIVTEGETPYDSQAQIKLGGDVIQELEATLAALDRL